MKKYIFTAILLIFSTSCMADENSKNEFLRDGFAIAAKTCKNQADFDYMSASAALSNGFRDQAIILARRTLKAIGADESGAEGLADRRINFFSNNIALAKLVTTPGMVGERYQQCLEQSIHDLNKAVGDAN